MKRELMLGAGRGPRLSVLELLRNEGEGLGVGEIANHLGMSYMGVKAHCVALTASGHLETRRGPSSKGRPVLLHRLSPSGESLFRGPRQRLALGLLREAEKLFGATAPQKLLLLHFRSETARYREALSGEGILAGRLKAFAKMRTSEGRMPSLGEAELEGKSADGWIYREAHDPDAEVMEAYPVACGYEEHMVGEVLGLPVERMAMGRGVLFKSRGR